MKDKVNQIYGFTTKLMLLLEDEIDMLEDNGIESTIGLSLGIGNIHDCLMNAR